jgi:hypothetical protein
MGRIEALALGQNRPQNPRVLVGDGDHRSVQTDTCPQLYDPAREPVIASMG